jgi:hypothetical protein
MLTNSPGTRYLFPRPLEVGGKNEADIRIRILVNDSLRLLFVLQHIVDPIQGELLRLHGVSGARILIYCGLRRPSLSTEKSSTLQCLVYFIRRC